jgi:hypothetical protein
MSRLDAGQYESETSAEEKQVFSGFDTSAASTAPSTPSEGYTSGSTPLNRQGGLLPQRPLEPPHLANPLDKVFDPSRDDRPFEELLARARLPRTPFEKFRDDVEREIAKRTAANEKALLAKRASEFEEEKKALRAAKEQMSSMKIGER